MARIFAGLGLIGALMAFASCAKPVDYSTETGKTLFPYTGVALSKLRLTEVKPETLKLKGFDDIRVYRYSLKVSPSYTARGYLFRNAEKVAGKGGNRVLFGHWLGGIQGVDSGEWQFFREAALYAREGNSCVLPSGNYPWMTSSTATAEDIPLAVAQVNDYRIGLDILFSGEDGKAPKAMLIAHDYGAMFAILTAASDTRVGAAVIMAPAPRFYQWNMILRAIPAGRIMDDYRAAMLPYDPISVIGSVTVPLLFQYGKSDQFLATGDAESLASAAAHAEKDVRWYPVAHSLHRYETASAERKAWVEGIFSRWDTAGHGDVGVP